MTQAEMELFLLGICAQKDEQGIWYFHDASGPRQKAKTITNGYMTLRGTKETWVLLAQHEYVLIEGVTDYRVGDLGAPYETRHYIRLTEKGMAAIINCLLKENAGSDPDFFVRVAEEAIIENREPIKRFIR